MIAHILALSISACSAEEQCATLSGHVRQGQRYDRPFGAGMRFQLQPGERGWQIAIRDGQRNDDISRMTPPFHFVPNPRDIEGWHFRNVGNTGPNDGSVNAPTDVREFLFSPDVGRSMEYPFTHENVTRTDLGRGRLTVTQIVLGNLTPGGRATIREMSFRVELRWPRSWPGGPPASHAP